MEGVEVAEGVGVALPPAPARHPQATALILLLSVSATRKTPEALGAERPRGVFRAALSPRPSAKPAVAVPASRLPPPATVAVAQVRVLSRRRRERWM